MNITANVVDIRNRRIYPAKIEVEGDVIRSILPVQEACSTYVLPGFIDAHIHIESSMLIPSEFARMAVRHGSVGAVCDPHEIANVLGIKGVEFMIENGDATPFKFLFGASPCVPATSFETSGAVLDAAAVETLLDNPKIGFLSEVMNFPGVLFHDEELMAKIEAAKQRGKPIDGHAPGLGGEDLRRYIDAGITTDHEATTYEEALEKLQNGMSILIREGSAAKNFDALHPLIDEWHDKLMLCSDDRHPDDLRNGHINSLVSRAVREGHDLFDVLQMACINPVEHYALDIGTLREGEKADFIVVSDLEEFRVLQTFINGECVAREGESLLERLNVVALNRFETTTKRPSDFEIGCCESTEVMVAIDHQLLTRELKEHLECVEGKSRGSIEHDVLKIAVINRYADAPPAVAFIHGFGLKRGAIASSIAHDSHNIVVVGCSDEAICEAVNRLIECRGGICAVSEDEEHVLALDIGGIMSSRDGFEVAGAYERIGRFATQTLGSELSTPFMTLSFMALLVIPDLKLSDRGLFDGRRFCFVPVCSSE